MKLAGTISKRFREKQECNFCENMSTWKAKCWAEDDLSEVYYACKKCHDRWSLCDCERPEGAFMGIDDEDD